MRRWLLPIVAVALLVPAVIADDSSDSPQRQTLHLFKRKPAAQPQQGKVIRVVVLEEAQPQPAGPSAPAAAAPAPAPAPVVGTPAIIISDPAIAGVDAGCGDGSQAAAKRHKGLFSKKPSHSENCVGCGGFCYDMWFAFSSCRSFFGEGRHAPRYPDDCPTCDHGICKHKK
jgi:hypothetical protein